MRVLIVEDDAQQRELLKRAVQEAATEVIEASNADEAVAAPGPFDLIIADYTLPGNKTARDIARARSERLVVLSGYDREDKAPDWNVLWYRKPISLRELRNIVEQLRGERRA